MLAHDHAVSIFHLSFLRYAPLIIRGDAAIPLYFFFASRISLFALSFFYSRETIACRNPRKISFR